MIIYKITNNINGKMYIGLTSVSLRERWTNHKSNCRNPAKYTSALYSAMRKYGVDNFSIEQIDSAGTLESLNLLEIHYIAKFDTISPKGYNLDNGGGSQNCHPETRAKISASLKGRPIKNRMNGAPKGRPVSQERRERISATMTGQPQPWKYKAVIDSNGAEYESVNACAKALKVNRVTISGLIKSAKQGSMGLSFKFKESK